MPAADRPDLILDARLVSAARTVTAATVVPAALLGGLAAGWTGAAGAAWGITAVGLNGVVAAWLSEQGGRTERGIGVVRVLVGIPIRLALLAAAIAVAVLVLDLPSRPVALSVCMGEIAVMVAQCWLVLRSPLFLGPLRPAELKGDT